MGRVDAEQDAAVMAGTARVASTTQDDQAQDDQARDGLVGEEPAQDRSPHDDTAQLEAASRSREAWGAALYGSPCRQCGFDFSIAPDRAIDMVAGVPDRFRGTSAAAAGGERGAGWSVAEYTSHVADNLRMWAERVQAARLAGQVRVAGYDPDELAAARGYAGIPLAAAQWSLELSASAWCQVLRAAVDEGVVLQHQARGEQRAEDIARNNAHDAAHHLWDVRTILAGS